MPSAPSPGPLATPDPSADPAAVAGPGDIAEPTSAPPVRRTARPLAELPGDPLALDPEEMRRLGYWVVDQVVAHVAGKGSGPAVRVGDPGDLRSTLGGPVPSEPGDVQAAMEALVDVALPHMQHGDHPRYFARVPGPSSFPAVLGEWLGTGHQAIATSWGGGSGPATVELVVCEWLASVLGLPESTEGVLLSGGSMANVTALVAVRAVLGEGVAYLSDQTHSSIARGLRLLGWSAEQISVVPTGEDLRLPVEELRRRMAADREAGRRPLVVIATAGTTNTGTVDPLEDLADLCAIEDVWLHVDGAYGGPAALCAPGRDELAGITRADSVVLDPHKWLFQPYDVGCLLVTRPGVLERAYTMNPEYLADVTAGTGEVDLRNRSLELSRRSRALKLWLTMRGYGTRALADAVERGIALAEHAEGLLRADPFWEVVTPAQLGVVTFAAVGATGEDHTRAAAALSDDGYAALTTTTLHGRSVLRLCTINPATTGADLEGTLTRLAAYL
ncbi:L-2,4-diaminobutyrate decarboxylase [Nostocoides japonicum T1-X7]|uniref:L-2,4-diaminobutyrate decarboxylase n=1 Tax=Nostocoides japonicum T1-X7 TaxID=1194083 RepID=A0A077LV34_9MICO|nr:aminotransferase class I/II-fold pyridoxal phosphate-dependent enzyme [Tetrasphaera japonica]CCH75870.1 L-2,4-diaminobutyrate decarboxylase [Tetrasphaera japonica T1-X7]